MNTPKLTSGLGSAPASAAAIREATKAPPARTRLVTDAPTRMFHALMALSFTGAYLTAESEHWRHVHTALGYGLAGLLVLRVAYGWFGPRASSLALVFRKLGGLPTWLRGTADAVRRLGWRAVPWQQAQHLLMAAAIASLLVLVAPLVLTGLGSLNDWGDALGGEAWPELHEFFGNAMLLAALTHVGVIAALSLLRRQNQAQRMLNGRVRGAGPDLVQHNRRWLAVLLLLAYGAAIWALAQPGIGTLS